MAATRSGKSKMALASEEKNDGSFGSSGGGAAVVINSKRRNASAEPGSAPGSRDAGGRRPRAVAARRAEQLEVEEQEDVNEAADAFIRRFREELHLQRLQSIENYNQMLARGL